MRTLDDESRNTLDCLRPCPRLPSRQSQMAMESRQPTALPLAGSLNAMSDGTTAERTERLGRLLDQLDASGRWALLKLLGGAPRVGVSARLARTALAECYGRDVSEIEEIWHALEPPYLELFAWLDGKSDRPDPGSKPVFRPVCWRILSRKMTGRGFCLKTSRAEWKWDGIRVQVAARGSDVRMFSRQGDDISAAFPEIRAAFIGADCVTDGELLVMRNGEIAPFNDLQQRLNRKTVTAKMMSAIRRMFASTIFFSTTTRTCARFPSASAAPGSRRGTPNIILR